MTQLTHSRLKGLFSKQADKYGQFRPTYPRELFEYLASIAPGRQLAWDCATGNGQAAVKLGEFFEQVVGTDLNENQIAHAEPHAHVSYRLVPAEESGLTNQSVDLITVAQAYHWFKQDLFTTEAKRVLKPGGVIAVWCYSLARTTPEIDPILRHFCYELLKDYWEKERGYIDDFYRGIYFPFQELKTPTFHIHVDWTLEHVLGYLGTWSALQTYLKANPNTANPLQTTYKEQLKAVWPKGDTHGASGSQNGEPTVRLNWELGLRVGRV